MANDTTSKEERTESTDSTDSRMAWVDAMEDIFASAVDRQAEIEMELEDMDVSVPLQLGDDPSYANWELNGTVKFRFDGVSGPLAEWLRYYAQGKLPLPDGQHDANQSENNTE